MRGSSSARFGGRDRERRRTERAEAIVASNSVRLAVSDSSDSAWSKCMRVIGEMVVSD